MFASARLFLRRHPSLRDALLWAIPAILIGAALRLLLLSYMPYAYWGSDSRSYFSFAHKLLSQGYVSLDEKRRFLYPIFLLPIAALPGEPLRWLAWIQHGIGLLTLVPLAYLVRKTLPGWKLWVIPVTLIYAGMPMVLWYEHELLGENIFFATLLWTFAGWVAWVREPDLARSRRLFWCFFIPFALFILTKPSGRFVWPGIVVGLVLAGAWRRLDWTRFAAIGVLMIVTLTVGSKKQGAWLLYVATFPLTQLESPKHADFKAEIRGDVEPLHRNLGVYYLNDDWPFAFLENPGLQEERPLWKTLQTDVPRKSRLFMDLAIEGIKAEPANFLYFAVQRLVGSANPSQFKDIRFQGQNYVDKFEHFYEESQSKERSPLRMLFALPKKGPLPPYSEFQKRISPAPNGWAARTLQAYVQRFENVSELVRLPNAQSEDRKITAARPTPLGWWLLAAFLLALLPQYRATYGVWMVVALSYLLGVFLVSQINPRYFGAAWPVLVPLLAVPADFLVSLVTGWFKPQRQA
ncbi:MAG: hypothetical protein JWL90_3030 [Chthoniobacteraceae bacterium]|nr:hypothetical protein [Chthoniobacteraceae bacterium]